MSLAKITNAAYYVPYVEDGSESVGESVGEGAKQIGLSGKISRDAFNNVLNGLHPDGTHELIRRSAIRNDRTHVPGWDWSLNDPKPASVLMLFKEFVPGLNRSQRKGALAVLKYVEENCAFVRRGHGGKRLEKCKLICFFFEHFTSRSNEPQRHTHLLIANVGAHSNGFGTIVSDFLYDHQTAINRVYLAALAKSLQEELGVTILAKEPKPFEPGDTFRIAGIPDNLCELFSSRRAEILTARAKFGVTTARGMEILALSTRQPKTHVPLNVLRPIWRKAAESIGIDLKELKAAILSGVSEKLADGPIQREPTVDTLKKTQPAAPQSNVRPFPVRSEPQEVIGSAASSPPPQSVQAPQATPTESTSPKIAASIIESLTKSAIANRMPDPIIDRLIDQVLNDFDRKHRPEKLKHAAARSAEAEIALGKLRELSDELKADVRHAVDPDYIKHGLMGRLTSGGADTALVEAMSKTGAVVCVDTQPGVDANLFVQALAREYQRVGDLKVRAFTSTPTGASELETTAGIPVHTVGHLLHRLKSSALDAGKHHAVQILRAAMNLPTAGRWKFDAKTVVCITQAQSLRSVDLARILQEVKASHAKLVLLGAPSQIARREPLNAFSKFTERAKSVLEARSSRAKESLSGAPAQLARREPHNAFSEIAKIVGRIRLSEPAIQTEKWMKDAVRQVSLGDVRGALSHYVLADRLHLAKDQRAATVDLINHWRTLPKREQNGKTLIIAASERDTRVLNKLAQHSRRESGGLGLLMHQRVDSTWVHRGDRILFRISSKHYGFKAGDVGTITRIGLSGMQIKLDRTRWALLRRPAVRVHVPKNLYRGLSLGYAVSAADAQNMTCDRALVLPRAGGEDIRGMLVQLSRARNDTRIFTTSRSVGEDIEAIQNGFRKQQQRPSQIEIPVTEKPIHATLRDVEKQPQPSPQPAQTQGIRL